MENMENEQYYIDNEKKRIEHLKKRMPQVYKDILKKEQDYRDGLIMMVLKYKNKEKYFKNMIPMISLKYIDFIRDFTELDESKIKKLTSNERKEYKEVSGKFMDLIPVKAKMEYESRGLISTKSHQKYLHFLKLNELLK